MSNPPNICFVIEDFYPVMHGATTQLLQLAERLSRRGSKITIVTRRVHKSHSKRETKDGFEIVRVMPAIGMHRLGKYLMIPPAFVALFSLRRAYDWVIVCDLKALGVLGVAAAKCLGKRSILRAESCGEMDGSYALRETSSTAAAYLIGWGFRMRNSLLFHADRYLSISSAIYKEFVDCGVPPSRITQLANGVDLRRFAPPTAEMKQAMRRSMRLPDGAIFVYTGRLARGKGLDILLDAWKELAEQRAEGHLLLVGSGQGYAMSCEAQLKDFVALNHLSKRVTFTGNVENVEHYLQAADFFVLPSQTESFGLSLLEAMACGLPCIATSVGGITDIVDDGINGRLVPFGDRSSLLKAMTDFLDDPDEAARLGRSGRDKVEKTFDLDRIADRYLTLFHQEAH